MPVVVLLGGTILMHDKYVHDRLADLSRDTDLSRFIL